MSTIIAITSIYLFILIGFTAKKIFQDQIDEKTLILISVYFLQPMLTFWGLTRAPIDYNLVLTPLIYFVIIFTVLAFLLFFARFIFEDDKDRSIFIAASLIGNTGNLGIPLGIALFGESSVAYTSMINIANVFFIYTVGIYFYAKGSFDIKTSLQKMVQMPILWFAIIAIVFNSMQFSIHPQINQILQMGAYAGIVLQLIIFGVYLSKTPLKSHNYKLSLSVSFVKLIFLPLVGMMIIKQTNLPNELIPIFLLSLLVPLAVNNVNLAALYDCKPYDVTAVVLVSTVLFLFVFYFDLKIIEYLF